LEKPGFIVKFYDKAHENQNIDDLCKAPISSISGISKADAEDLRKAFGIETVEDLAYNKYVNLAQGISCLSESSGQILDWAFNSNEYKKLLKQPITAMAGVSWGDAAFLKRAFGIDNIKELAENKYVAVAQATVTLARIVQFLNATP
jgi:hypothetical protein